MTALATDSGRKTPARLAGSAILGLQSDERLVRLVRAGHERAFDAIVERYRRPLVRYCARILPESRCEDAVQQAFINAHAALTSSDDAVQLKAWLFTITRNAALNMLRQNGWNYDQIPLDFDGVRRPDQVFEQRIELQETVAALGSLPDRQRDALVMREFEGRSYDEIAAALGANDGAVRQLLNRARVTLRNAASMLVPPPLLARAASGLPPGDGRRLAEIVGGLGGAGLAKAGATALVAGSLVVGAVEAPSGDSHKPSPQKATLSATPSAHDTSVSGHASAARSAAAATKHTSSHSGSSHGASSPVHEHRGRGSGDDSRERSGTSGGSDDHTRTRSGSGGDDSPTRSGSDDRSGSSGGGGSDDVVVTAPSGSDNGGTSGSSGISGSSGSGSSGSGTSGSGTSGSGSSGSGSDDVMTTTTTTTATSTSTSNSGRGSSGSDDSMTSGSSSGSGSSNLLDH